MTTEATEPEVPVSEEQVVEQAEPEQIIDEPRRVPLEALEAERRKRQELEIQLRALQEAKSTVNENDTDEEDDEFITKAELKKRLKDATFGNKRELLEETFCSTQPQAIEMINKHLEGIIKRKPWLAQTIESAPNRYARAYEIVQDYMPKEEVTSASRLRSPQAEAKKIVENSQKPGSPATIAKASNGSNMDYLKSIQGKPEFREYRQKLRSGG